MEEPRLDRQRVARRKLLRLGGIGAVGAGSAWLIACGGGDRKETSATAGAGAAAAGRAGTQVAGAGTQVAGIQPKTGGKFVSSFAEGMTLLDPHMERISYHLEAFNKLLKTPPDGKVVNDLATGYEQPDAETYIFKLPAEAPFHDLPPVSGRGMAAEDVAYSFKRMVTPKPEFQKKYYFDRMKSIEGVDKQTVRLVTDGPFAPQLGYVAATHAVVVPREAVEQFGDLREHVIGTGPFQMTGYQAQVSYSFKRHPRYFRKGLPYLDEVELLRIADTATAIARFRSKQLDFVAVTGRDARQLRGGGFQEFESDGNSLQIRPNVTRPPFNDPRVRRALHLAVDRQQLIDLVLGGAGYIYTDLPRYFPAALKPDELLKMPGFRPDKNEDLAEARKLLGAAGYGGGFAFESIAYTPEGPDNGEVLRNQFAALGIKYTPRQVARAEFTTLQLEKRSDALLTPSSQRDEVDEYYYAVYHSKGSRNDTGLADPQVDALCEAQQRETNPEKRNKILRDLSLKLLEAPAWVPLHTQLSYDFEQPEVRGLARGAINYWQFLLEETWRG